MPIQANNDKVQQALRILAESTRTELEADVTVEFTIEIPVTNLKIYIETQEIEPEFVEGVDGGILSVSRITLHEAEAEDYKDAAESVIHEWLDDVNEYALVDLMESETVYLNGSRVLSIDSVKTDDGKELV